MIENLQHMCLAELQAFLGQAGEIEAIADGRPIFESSSIDSVTLVGMVVALENRFRIEFDVDNVEEVFFDLSTLSSFVSDKLAQQARR